MQGGKFSLLHVKAEINVSQPREE